MEAVIKSFKCPNCGGAIQLDQKVCEYCDSPVVITTFESVDTMPLLQVNKYVRAYTKELADNPDSMELNNSIAMCYLKLKLYDKALPAFEKAMEDNFENSETFFYAAVCLLQGKKAFLHLRPTIDKILEYLNAAIMIEPKGIYYYFIAYIKQDYFSRKYLITSPNYREVLATAKQAGYTESDVQRFYALLGVPRPAGL